MQSEPGLRLSEPVWTPDGGIACFASSTTPAFAWKELNAFLSCVSAARRPATACEDVGAVTLSRTRELAGDEFASPSTGVASTSVAPSAIAAFWMAGSSTSPATSDARCAVRSSIVAMGFRGAPAWVSAGGRTASTEDARLVVLVEANADNPAMSAIVTVVIFRNRRTPPTSGRFNRALGSIRYLCGRLPWAQRTGTDLRDLGCPFTSSAAPANRGTTPH